MKEWILANLLPFGIVNENEMGVEMRGGKYHATLNPGIYWVTPLVNEIMTIETRMQVLDTPNIRVTDPTGTTWSVSGCISYFVEDAKKALLDIQDYDDALMAKVMSLVVTGIYDGLSNLALEDYIMDVIPEWGMQYGLTITEFKLNELCKGRVLIHMGIGV